MSALAARRRDGALAVSYDRRTRDRYRLVVTGVTGAAGVGALTPTGGLMGIAAARGRRRSRPTSRPQPTSRRAHARPPAQPARRAASCASGPTSPG